QIEWFQVTLSAAAAPVETAPSASAQAEAARAVTLNCCMNFPPYSLFPSCRMRATAYRMPESTSNATYPLPHRVAARLGVCGQCQQHEGGAAVEDPFRRADVHDPPEQDRNDCIAQAETAGREAEYLADLPRRRDRAHEQIPH